MGRKRKEFKLERFNSRRHYYKLNQQIRDYNSAEYKQFRLDVKERDNYQCRFPGCNGTFRLHVHHIKKYASNPLLRYVISNGITLCNKHHRLVTGKEESYESMFYKILHGVSLDSILQEIEDTEPPLNDTDTDN